MCAGAVMLKEQLGRNCSKPARFTETHVEAACHSHLPPLVFSCSVEMKIFSAASRGAVPNLTRPGSWCDDAAPSSPLYAPAHKITEAIILAARAYVWQHARIGP